MKVAVWDTYVTKKDESQFCHVEELKPEGEEDIRRKGVSTVEMKICH